MKEEKAKICILYPEIMPYNIVALKYFMDTVTGFEIDIYSWNFTKKLTPYIPPAITNINYFNESEFTEIELLNRLISNDYKIIIVGGRSEKRYLNILKKLKKYNNELKVVATSDEILQFTFRQFVKKMFSSFLYKQYFDYFLVPGLLQKKYIKFIGYAESQIYEGSLSCDVDYLNKKTIQLRKMPPKFSLLFVGRLEKVKGLDYLIEALQILKEKYNLKIELHIVGSGSMKNEIKNLSNIFTYDFLNIDEIIDLSYNTSFFILPSLKEPWGVVLHEMAAIGMPIICSDICGAKDYFVIDKHNGYVFKNKSKRELVNVIRKASQIDLSSWNQMSQNSYRLSQKIHPLNWTNSILKILNLKDMSI